MDDQKSGADKFQSCKHRSEEEIEVEVKRCPCQGGSYKARGFNCEARSIFKVSPAICESCWAFEQKQSN
jgi:hypothetical protein